MLTRTPTAAVGAVGAGLGALAVHAAPALLSRGRWRTRVTPALVGQGEPGGVALTFDDGPDPDGTPAVLAALAALGWTATFFLLGSQLARHPEVARAVVDEGHEVAVHGWAHRNHLARSAPDVVRDVTAATRLVTEVTGALPRWYRPPYGVLSAPTLVAARAARLRPVLWTAWGRDWLAPGPAEVAATVLAGLRDGGTVLLHDSDCTSRPASWRSTAAALPLLAREVEHRGWAVRTLSEHLPAWGRPFGNPGGAP